MRILAIGCHPDDLEIGCYGTLAKYAQQGHEVSVCHVANGNLGHVEILPEELRKIRYEEELMSVLSDEQKEIYEKLSNTQSEQLASENMTHSAGAFLLGIKSLPVFGK